MNPSEYLVYRNPKEGIDVWEEMRQITAVTDQDTHLGTVTTLIQNNAIRHDAVEYKSDHGLIRVFWVDAVFATYGALYVVQDRGDPTGIILIIFRDAPVPEGALDAAFDRFSKLALSERFKFL